MIKKGGGFFSRKPIMKGIKSQFGPLKPISLSGSAKVLNTRMKKRFDDEIRRRVKDDEEYKESLMQRERAAKGTKDNRMNPGEIDDFNRSLQEFEALQELQAKLRKLIPRNQKNKIQEITARLQKIQEIQALQKELITLMPRIKVNEIQEITAILQEIQEIQASHAKNKTIDGTKNMSE